MIGNKSESSSTTGPRGETNGTTHAFTPDGLFPDGHTESRALPALQNQEELMGVRVKLRKHPGTGSLQLGPIVLQQDGTIKIGELAFPLGAVPETGMTIQNIELARSGPDLIAVRHKQKMILLSYAHNSWYVGQAPEG